MPLPEDDVVPVPVPVPVPLPEVDAGIEIEDVVANTSLEEDDDPT